MLQSVTIESLIATRLHLEIARDIINAATLEPFDGKIVAKRLAFNEAEYAMNPDLYSGVMIRNVMADMDNRSLTPFSQSWDSALTMVGNAFRQVGIMGLDIMGFDQAEAYLLGKADYTREELAKKPKVRLDTET